MLLRLGKAREQLLEMGFAEDAVETALAAAGQRWKGETQGDSFAYLMSWMRYGRVFVWQCSSLRYFCWGTRSLDRKAAIGRKDGC